jgi:hypothetical protein
VSAHGAEQICCDDEKMAIGAVQMATLLLGWEHEKRGCENVMYNSGVPAGALPTDEPFSIRIIPHGSGWYWEVVSPQLAVVVRGIAHTREQAREEADKSLSPTLSTIGSAAS